MGDPRTRIEIDLCASTADNAPAAPERYWTNHLRREYDRGRDDELARVLLYLGDMDIGDEHDHALYIATERLRAKNHRGLALTGVGGACTLTTGSRISDGVFPTPILGEQCAACDGTGCPDCHAEPKPDNG